jgi:GNAT superfamily N-acetyltransferase
MSFRIERAGPEAVETIVEHRRAIFAESGHGDSALSAMATAFRPWLEQRMRRDEYLGWLAVADDRVVAGAGLWLIDWPPGMLDPTLPRADILNVYTIPEYRRRGMARALVAAAVEWCRTNRAVRVVRLNSTPAGRTLYESLGFQPENAMRLTL